MVRAMSRLIDADALIKAWRKKHKIKEGDCGAVFTGYSEIPRLIDEQPTVDAVEVVRCKDCKWWYLDADTEMACEYTEMGQPEDGYCNWAERRSDE